jgi:hypothetical protein
MADLGQPTVSKHKQSSCLILSAYCSRHNWHMNSISSVRGAPTE